MKQSPQHVASALVADAEAAAGVIQGLLAAGGLVEVIPVFGPVADCQTIQLPMAAM